MRILARLIIVAQMLIFFPGQILFPFQANYAAGLNSGSEEKYSEYFKKGESLRLQGDYEESIKYFEKSLDLAQKTNNKKDEIESLIKLGLLSWNIGKIKKSSEILGEALSVINKTQINEKKDQVSNFMQIYKFYRDGKQSLRDEKYQKAIKDFDKAIELARKIESEEHELKCLREQSLSHLYLDDIESFLPLNQEALEIARRIRHKQEEVRCLFNIGYYYRNKDNYSQALRHYEEALSRVTMSNKHRRNIHSIGKL
jgi:tetratricopeptide (TPR) repeat protein